MVIMSHILRAHDGKWETLLKKGPRGMTPKSELKIAQVNFSIYFDNGYILEFDADRRVLFLVYQLKQGQLGFCAYLNRAEFTNT